MGRRPAVGKKKTTEQAGKAAFPAQLTWSEEIVWQLLAEVEKTENRKVLLGTRSGEVSLCMYLVYCYSYT